MKDPEENRSPKSLANDSIQGRDSSSSGESKAQVPYEGTVCEVREYIHGRGLISSFALGISEGLLTNLAFLAGFAWAIGNSSLIRLAGIASVSAGATSIFFEALRAMRSESNLKIRS